MSFTFKTEEGKILSDNWGHCSFGSIITINKNIFVRGLYMWTTTSSEYTMLIWDKDTGNELASSSVINGITGSWVYFPLLSPVELEANKGYMIAGYTNSGAHGYGNNIPVQTEFNGVTFKYEPYSMYYYGSSKRYPSTLNNGSYVMMFGIEFDFTKRKILVQSGETIQNFSGSWQDIGNAPVTEQMFLDHGMGFIDTITAEQWSKLPKESKLIIYTTEDEILNADVTTHGLYDSVLKRYKGTGVIETEMEELPVTRRTLMINADHVGCTFKYSLNNGSTWTSIQPEEMKDIKSQSGMELKIQVTLPTDDASITSLSYAWA